VLQVFRPPGKHRTVHQRLDVTGLDSTMAEEMVDLCIDRLDIE